MPLRPFGIHDGQPVTEATLSLPSGVTAAILDYGAIVRDLHVPDRDGRPRRVVLGFPDLAGYLADRQHLGTVAGRYANRIAHGRFQLDGRTWQLTRNERGIQHLHGGERGFGRRRWRIVEHDEQSVSLALTSPDGEEGYPGRVEVRCDYRLQLPATLAIDLSATTDAPTVVNLAHHSYFTLDYGRSIAGQRLQVNAAFYTPTDRDLIPTGAIADVAATPYDFRTPHSIGAGDFAYDINFVLARAGAGLTWAATLASADNALSMDVHTTEPGLQFFDGSYLGGGPVGHEGFAHFPRAGLCLEPQHYPDSPNHPNFPSTVVRPDEIYRQRTEYRFATGRAVARAV